ncbi:MAG: carboxymuconolactone decarboxylase family protein [Cyclobacteriaceae bacterium]
MKNLEVLTRKQVAPQTQEVYDNLNKAVGMVPNLYATAAHSHNGLTALLGLGETLKKGNFNGKEIEAVALAVSQTNQCGYCLSAHTAVGKMQGFSDEETLDIRSGAIKDTKLKVLTDLAKEITATRGFPTVGSIDRFFEQGYSKGALVDLIGLVSLNTFTNYLNHIAGTEIDFPLAPEINREKAA